MYSELSGVTLTTENNGLQSKTTSPEKPNSHILTVSKLHKITQNTSNSQEKHKVTSHWFAIAW